MIDFKIWLQGWFFLLLKIFFINNFLFYFTEIMINDLNQDCMIKAYRTIMALGELFNHHHQLQSTHQSSIGKSQMFKI